MGSLFSYNLGNIFMTTQNKNGIIVALKKWTKYDIKNMVFNIQRNGERKELLWKRNFFY